MRQCLRAVAACAAVLTGASLLAVLPAAPALAGDGGTIGVTVGSGSVPPSGPTSPVGCGVPSCRTVGHGGNPGAPARPTGATAPPPGGQEVDLVQRIYGSQFWPEGKPPRTLDGVPPVADGGRYTGCAPVARGGHTQGSVGATWSYGVTYRTVVGWATPFDLPPLITPGSLTYSCQYPPAFSDSEAICALTLTGTIVGPIDTPDVGSKTLVTKTQQTGFSRSRTLANCLGSWRLNLSTGISVYGRYQGDAKDTAVRCVVRHYLGPNPRTGKIPPDTLVYPTPCGAPFLADAAQSRGQLDCTGWKNVWDLGAAPSGLPWSFRASDCPAGKPGTKITCTVSGAPTVVLPNGSGPSVTVKTKSLQVLDDGKRNQVTWPRPTIRGAAKVFAQSTTLLRAESGTPWRAHATPLDEPFQSDLNNPRSGLVPGPWLHQFFSAGLPGMPTVTHLHYVQDALWPSTVVTVTGMDTQGGGFTVGTRAGTVRAIGTCDSDPLTVDAFRVRLSSSN